MPMKNKNSKNEVKIKQKDKRILAPEENVINQRNNIYLDKLNENKEVLNNLSNQNNVIMYNKESEQKKIMINKDIFKISNNNNEAMNSDIILNKDLVIDNNDEEFQIMHLRESPIKEDIINIEERKSNNIILLDENKNIIIDDNIKRLNIPKVKFIKENNIDAGQEKDSIVNYNIKNMIINNKNINITSNSNNNSKNNINDNTTKLNIEPNKNFIDNKVIMRDKNHDNFRRKDLKHLTHLTKKSTLAPMVFEKMNKDIELKKSKEYNNIKNISSINNINNTNNDGDSLLRNFKIERDFLIQESNSDPYENYSIIKCLGEGSFGKVYKVQHKVSLEFRAMKEINKYSAYLSQEEEEELLKEIKILTLLDHPGIIKIYEFYNTQRKLFIISELCTGGELFDRIVEVKYFTETVAAHIMKQIFSATAFCHANNIIHRDLKPENILIDNLDERKKDFFNIKIIDFGTSEINKQRMLSEKTGTAYYIAPEVINNCYNEKCDLWSCGVILYILLCGCPPFSGNTDEEIFEKIKVGSFKFKGPVWNDISKEAISLINSLLTKDLNKRLNAQQALNHSWFKNMFTERNKDLLEYQKINFPKTHLKDIITNIKHFRAEKKLQQAALAFIVHNLAHYEDILELRNVFTAFDLNGDGRLTKDELIKGMSQVMTKGEAKANVEKIMETIDVDNNGFIEYEEFLRASLNKEKLLSKENIRMAFNLFDRDGSGFISKEEIKSVLGKGKADNVENVWEKIIEEIDLNQDGEISFEEFAEMMYKLIEKNVS